MSRAAARWVSMTVGVDRHPESHPALHPNPGYHLLASDPTPDAHDKAFDNGRHFVPVGWEEADRGICPCGEVVRWDEETTSWVPDRSLRVLILTGEDVDAIRAAIGDRVANLAEDPDDEPASWNALDELIVHQNALNEEVG